MGGKPRARKVSPARAATVAANKYRESVEKVYEWLIAKQTGMPSQAVPFFDPVIAEFEKLVALDTKGWREKVQQDDQDRMDALEREREHNSNAAQECYDKAREERHEAERLNADTQRMRREMGPEAREGWSSARYSKRISDAIWLEVYIEVGLGPDMWAGRVMSEKKVLATTLAIGYCDSAAKAMSDAEEVFDQITGRKG